MIAGQSITGFDLQKLGGNYKALWLIPISCGLCVVAGYLKQGQKSMAQFAGAFPFFVLAFWLHEYGLEFIKKALAFGAYAGLGLALLLVILSVKSKN